MECSSASDQPCKAKQAKGIKMQRSAASLLLITLSGDVRGWVMFRYAHLQQQEHAALEVEEFVSSDIEQRTCRYCPSSHRIVCEGSTSTA